MKLNRFRSWARLGSHRFCGCRLALAPRSPKWCNRLPIRNPNWPEVIESCGAYEPVIIGLSANSCQPDSRVLSPRRVQKFRFRGGAGKSRDLPPRPDDLESPPRPRAYFFNAPGFAAVPAGASSSTIESTIERSASEKRSSADCSTVIATVVGRFPSSAMK